MRLLLGSQINDLTLERGSESHGNSVGVAWRVVTSEVMGTDSGSADHQPTEVNLPPPETPTEQLPPPRGSDQ